MKTFPSSKSLFTLILFWTLTIFLIAILFVVLFDVREKQPPFFIFCTIISTVLLCLIWILLDTKYTINEKTLCYRSGPISGKIEIEKIRKIQHHSGIIVPVLLKPALNSNGLIINYNKFDEIYISPKEEKEFLDMLLQINPAIEII